MSAPEQLLGVDAVSVVLGSRTAVRDASLTVSSGELVGLLGTPGAGKTTLLHAILGLASPAAGGVDAVGLAGYVPQRHEFAWDFPIDVSARY
ncbi:ATP-binding cassette domain-containing protein [Streptomyces sp. NPDC056930]|uniref:ATP-binding cassette domain-containing protein n=1 Tax=Streptomyces sp. NPDC056930 TaxID=3345967 RepID=UPI00363BE3B6